jgi:hypothetical protein
MFRPELLVGRRVAFAGADQTPAATAIDELGAAIELVPEILEEEEELQAWVAARLPLHGLVFDARPRFDAGGVQSLTAALERAWVVARAVATEALIPARAGRLIFIAPRPEPDRTPRRRAPGWRTWPAPCRSSGPGSRSPRWPSIREPPPPRTS